MTDLPPRPPPRTEDRRVTDSRFSQTSMWLVFLVLGAVILAAIAFSVDRSTSVVDPTTAVPETTTAPAATETVPAETVPAEPGTEPEGGVDPAAVPETGTTEPAPTTGTTNP